MSKKECPPYVRTGLVESYHRDEPKDGPRVKNLKEHARKLSIETIWEEIDAWSTALITARLRDWQEKEDSRS